MPRTLKSFMFDVGNSDKGPVGMVIRVYARTRQEAIEKANAFLQDNSEGIDVPTYDLDSGDDVEYCRIYLAPNLKLHHIPSGETEDASGRDMEQ
jgi:hypothetical protein